MKWRVFFETVAAAAVAGAGDAVIQKMSESGPIVGKQVAVTAGVGAVVGIVNLLRKPPVSSTPAEPSK